MIGGLDFAGLARASATTSAHGTVPTLAFIAFQCMFAVITPALISGAFAERMQVLRVRAVHARLDDARLRSDRALGRGPTAAGSRKLGALDFAGGTVVHLSSGVSALVVALVLGKRRGYPTSATRRTT